MIAELALLGVVATAFVQFLKKRFSNNKATTLAILVVVSLLLAIGVWLLQEYNLWAWFLGIMASANMIYAFIVQHIEAAPDDWLEE